MSMAQMIAQHLRENDITEADLARSWGVSQRAISYYLTGERLPSEATLYYAWASGRDGLAGLLLAIRMPIFREAIMERLRGSFASETP